MQNEKELFAAGFKALNPNAGEDEINEAFTNFLSKQEKPKMSIVEEANVVSDVLFITEDNIEIKKGDKYHRVNISNIFNMICDFNLVATSDPENYIHWKNKNWGQYRVFGDEENAKFFLLIHTDVLNCNEILQLLNIANYGDEFAQKLVNYAVTKIQAKHST